MIIENYRSSQVGEDPNYGISTRKDNTFNNILNHVLISGIVSGGGCCLKQHKKDIIQINNNWEMCVFRVQI